MGAGQLGHKTYHAFVNQHPAGEHTTRHELTIGAHPAERRFTSISFITSSSEITPPFGRD
jgi:hypothetical protein